MASIQFIEKRITGKQTELEKLNKKLARIRKAEAGNWDKDNPYCYSESDLHSCLIDIKETQTALEKYQTQLATEQAKAESRNVKVILDFLENWKARSREFYIEMFDKYQVDKVEFRQKDHEYTEWFNHSRRNDPDHKAKETAYRTLRKNFNAKWAFITPYVHHVQNSITFLHEDALDMEKLNKDLDQEANQKYDFIIARTQEIVETITDASQLCIGSKGDLNGFIIGTRGTAKVETIGAGGYNIQRFHFRTLINKVN